MFAIERSRSGNIKNAIVCLEIQSGSGDMVSRSWWLFRLFQIISGTKSSKGSDRKKKLLNNSLFQRGTDPLPEQKIKLIKFHIARSPSSKGVVSSDFAQLLFILNMFL